MSARRLLSDTAFFVRFMSIAFTAAVPVARTIPPVQTYARMHAHH
jgi:hypothetical protein